MFNKFIKSVLYDDKTIMYLILVVVIYVFCFINLIPNQIISLINKPLFKCIIFGYIVFLSKQNLGGALLLTTIYFIILSCNKSENFLNTITSSNIKKNSITNKYTLEYNDFLEKAAKSNPAYSYNGVSYNKPISGLKKDDNNKLKCPDNIFMRTERLLFPNKCCSKESFWDTTNKNECNNCVDECVGDDDENGITDRKHACMAACNKFPKKEKINDTLEQLSLDIIKHKYNITDSLIKKLIPELDVKDSSEKILLSKNDLAKNIMRSIGCHRIRGRDGKGGDEDKSYDYGFYNVIDNKCEFKFK